MSTKLILTKTFYQFTDHVIITDGNNYLFMYTIFNDKSTFYRYNRYHLRKLFKEQFNKTFTYIAKPDRSIYSKFTKTSRDDTYHHRGTYKLTQTNFFYLQCQIN